MVAVLNRVWPIANRKLVNDVTGWQLGISGDDVWGDSRVHAVIRFGMIFARRRSIRIWRRVVDYGVADFGWAAFSCA